MGRVFLVHCDRPIDREVYVELQLSIDGRARDAVIGNKSVKRPDRGTRRGVEDPEGGGGAGEHGGL